jgi:membrane peptidoglycan carboxypeptidase
MDRADAAGGRTQEWQDPELGRGGYRGSRRAGSAAAAFGEQGGRRLTAVRDRTGVAERVGGRDGTGWSPDDERGSGRGPGRRGRGGGNGTGGGGWDGGNRRFNADGQPLSRGQRFKRWLLHGSWWRHWTWKKAVGVLFGGIAGLILLGILSIFIAYAMTPMPTAHDLTASWQSSTVYFSGGKQQLGTFDDSVNGVNVNRQLLTANQIPKFMTEAMTAAEDRQFYTEGGISVTGLMRAGFQDLFGSGNLQGGSTITMQYAKNYYSGVDTGQNLSTKLKEIFIAMKLGRAKSKSWIMTSYLNTIPFGPTTYGVGAAAENYFNVNLTQPGATLTVSQAAMLAAMPNSPGVFTPNPDGGQGYLLLKQRWHYVLTNMVRDGNITQQQMNEQVFPKYTPPAGGNGWSGYTGYLMTMVQQELEAPIADGGYGLTAHQIATGGYKIVTTFNWADVKALARSVNQEVAAMRAAGLPFHLYDRVGAVLEDSKTGGLVAVYGGPGYGSKYCNATNCELNTAEAAESVGSSFKAYVLSAAVNEGMSVVSSKLNGYTPIWIPLGVGHEQMLSRLKPPPGINPTSPYAQASNGIFYWPFLESGENFGKPLAPNVAAALSSDSAFEDLLHRAGIQNVIEMAKQFGVGQSPFVLPCANPASYVGNIAQTIADCNDMTGPGFKNSTGWHTGNGLDNNFSPTSNDSAAKLNQTLGSPAMALGENPLTPVEQATTFATLADHGLYHSPHVIQQLLQGSRLIPSHVQVRQVLTPAVAANVDWALSFDNNMSGATAEANVPYRRGDVIAKTGTLGQNTTSSQAWFVGATPGGNALSVALFTNNPGTQVLNNLPSVGGTLGSQGGGWPATIWNNFMTARYSNAPYVPLAQPTNGYPFVPWIQVVAPKKPACQPGQGQGHGRFKNCKGCLPIPGLPCNGGNPNPNPNPNPTCGGQFPGQQCGNPTPSPSPTCGQFGGQQCTSPSPSPSPSCTTPPIGQCNSPPGQGTGAGTTAARGSPPPPVVTTAAYTVAVAVLPGGLARLVSG